MDYLRVKFNSEVCLKSKFTSKCVGYETSTKTLKSDYPPAYVQTKDQIKSQRIEKPYYTLKLKIVNYYTKQVKQLNSRDIEKNGSQFVLEGNKVFLVNSLTDQYIVCSSTGEITFDKKSTLSDEVNKNFFKAATWTIQLQKNLKNLSKMIQSEKDFITIFDDLCFKSVHSTYLTLKSNLQLTALSELDTRKSTQPIWNLIEANTPYIPEWVFKRNSLNKFSKFHEMESQNLNPNARQKKQLKSFTPQIQEALLIEDILDIMLGFEGVYIKKRKERNQYVVEPYLQEPTCNRALTQLVYKILKLPTLETKIQGYIATYSVHEGTVCQALCGGLRDLVKQYKLMVIQFDSIAKEGQLTLQRLWYLSQASLKTMQSLSTLVDEAQKLKGGQLITCISKLLNENTDSQIIQVYNYLFTKIMNVYVQMLSKWMYEGVIQDKYQQFMIMTEQKSQNKEWSYWQEKFLIRENQIPSIFAKEANDILVTGKYLNILKACNKLQDHPLNKQLYIKFKKYIEIQNFSEPIVRAYEWANSEILKLVFEDCKLYDVLKSLKGFYFLEYGDLFVHFMDASESDLLISKKKVEGLKSKQFPEEKIQNLFQSLVRTSSANSDSFKQEVSIRVQSLPIYDQIIRIKTLEPDLHNFNYTQKAYIKKDSKYVDFLTLDFKFKFPLTLIFNRKNMAKYQVLFRFLFWCKFAERQLNSTWLSLQSTKQIAIPFYTTGYLLNQKMINFIKNFLYYLCYQVIEQNWQILHQNLKKVKTFQDIIEYHNNFLNKCLVESLLSNSTLLQFITADIGKSIEGFSTIRTLITKLFDEYNFEKDLQTVRKDVNIFTQRKMYIEQIKAQIKNSLIQSQFRQLIEGYGGTFEESMKKLLREVYHLVGKQENYLLNLLNRLDEEKYYNRRLFQNTEQRYQ